MSDEQSTTWSATVEAVYRTQARELWALFYAQCCDAERAHDALQEVFARLHEQNGQEIRDVRAWLVQVGRNWLRDVARRQKVAAKPVEFLETIPGTSAEPVTVVTELELQSQVREALAQLRTDDREVLVLRYALEWSSQRIADKLQITAAAVDMRLSRARKRLGIILEKAGVRPE